MQEMRFPGTAAEIPRIARWEEWDETRITFGKGRNTGFAIDRIQPDPEESSLGYPTHVMRFTVQAATPSKVRISTRPMHFGWTSALMAKMEAFAS
ncbi:hypothetical protein ACEUZ9_000483 [Paracoccus litorisediminis]|uniref:Uncharacterized protein n=1 Tax=Paracoccus litorisediminis TaxID=2006130 RepID=A0A844HPK1_9RHOB|nr:hypothetical protein [Paracoccus litorisediminis]MTH62313.1 hypothetical protein [Paracoccus litorisediminis]